MPRAFEPKLCKQFLCDPSISLPLNLSLGTLKLLVNSRKLSSCCLSKCIQFSIIVYGLLSDILNVLSFIRSRIHVSHQKRSQKTLTKILNYGQHFKSKKKTYFRLWGMSGKFLDISQLWGSIFNWQILSTFCNPPLQFNNLDTRQILAYPYLTTLIPA